MRNKTVAAVLTAALAFAPLMAACSNASNGGASNSTGTASSASTTSESTVSESATTSALDGAWRQVGMTDGADGIIGAVDGDSIALWIMNGGNKWKLWYGTIEAPKDNASYTWKSKAYKTNKDGRFTVDDEVLEFSYADGKISFMSAAQDGSTQIDLEQTSTDTGLLADLKAGEGASADVDATIEPIKIVDSGYVISNGFAQIAMEINNPNQKYAPLSMSLRITAHDAKGNKTLDESALLGTVLPGATTYWGYRVGTGTLTASDTIELKINVDDRDWYQTSEKFDFYQIENVGTTTGDSGSLVASGDLTITRDAKLLGSNNLNSPKTYCILKDASGKIVAGYAGSSMRNLPLNEKTSFTIDCGTDKVDFATAEVYANPWI